MGLTTGNAFDGILSQLPNIFTIDINLTVIRDGKVDKANVARNSAFRYMPEDDWDYKQEIKITDLINRVNAIVPEAYRYNLIKTYENLSNECRHAFEFGFYRIEGKDKEYPVARAVEEFFEACDEVLLDCFESDKAYASPNAPQDGVYFKLSYTAKDEPRGDILYSTEPPDKIIIMPFDL